MRTWYSIMLIAHSQGAQVLMIKNDPEKRWVNGSIGKIHSIAEKKIKVFNVPEYGSNEVADFAISLSMSFLKNLNLFYNIYIIYLFRNNVFSSKIKDCYIL